MCLTGSMGQRQLLNETSSSSHLDNKSYKVRCFDCPFSSASTNTWRNRSMMTRGMIKNSFNICVITTLIQLVFHCYNRESLPQKRHTRIHSAVCVLALSHIMFLFWFLNFPHSLMILRVVPSFLLFLMPCAVCTVLLVRRRRIWGGEAKGRREELIFIWSFPFSAATLYISEQVFQIPFRFSTNLATSCGRYVGIIERKGSF